MVKGDIRKKFYLILFILEPALLLPALVITTLNKTPFLSMFASPTPVYMQAVIGAALGICAGFAVSALIFRVAFFSSVKDFFSEIFSTIKIDATGAFWMSLLAGFFEEILFRGAIQPILGIWLTSFIFILLHGYFNPKDISMPAFGIIMFALSCVMGGLALRFGLICAMCFHFFYDFTALMFFIKPGIKSVFFPGK